MKRIITLFSENTDFHTRDLLEARQTLGHHLCSTADASRTDSSLEAEAEPKKAPLLTFSLAVAGTPKSRGNLSGYFT